MNSEIEPAGCFLSAVAVFKAVDVLIQILEVAVSQMSKAAEKHFHCDQSIIIFDFFFECGGVVLFCSV